MPLIRLAHAKQVKNKVFPDNCIHVTSDKGSHIFDFKKFKFIKTSQSGGENDLRGASFLIPSSTILMVWEEE